MRVVGPDHRLGLGAAGAKQRLQRVEHVTVAQIPGFCRTAVHQPVIALGGADDAGILRRVEIRLFVPTYCVHPSGQELVELFDRRVFARVLVAVDDGAAVFGRLVLPRGQAAVAPAGRGGGLRIDAVEVADDGGDRGAEAVDV